MSTHVLQHTESDVLQVRLADGEAHERREVAPGVFLLLGAGGALLGLHIEQASQQVPQAVAEAHSGFESKRLLQSVIDETPYPIILKDEDARFLLANKALANLYNTTPEAMVGHDDSAFGVPADMAAGFRENCLSIMARGETEVVREDSRDASTGEIRHYRSIKKPITDVQGRRQLLILAQDITDIVRSQQQVADSEARLQDVLRLSNVGIWDWEVDTGAVEHNAQWYRMLGREQGSIPGTVEAFAALIHPEDKPLVLERLQHMLDGKTEDYVSEHRLITPRGEIWVRDSGGIAQRDANGRPIRVRGSITDISRLKAAEARVRESEELLRSAIDTIDEALVIFDPQDRLVYCNQRYRDTYPLVADIIQVGITFEAIVRNWKERGGGEPAIDGIDAWVQDRVRAHREGGLFVQRTETGRYIRVLERATHQGYIVGFRIDITDLVEAQKAAEEANLAKSRFLATMSHELRTPLNGILGSAQLLMQPEKDEVQHTELTRTIMRSGQNLLTLLNDILDLSKVEAGKLELESLPCQPARLLSETRHLFLGAARDKGLTLTARWDGAESDTYMADRTRLAQMLNNLVSNAVKFTAHGAVTVTGRPLPAAPGAQATTVEFEVTDTGPGIEADQHHRLFKAFSQVDASTTRVFGGSGLGLSIVHRFTTLMGGDAGVRSTPGQGSTFWFRVPLPICQTTETRQGELKETSYGDGPVQLHPLPEGLRLLVVEDHPSNRFIIDNMLQRCGLRAQMAHHGQAALDRIEAGESYDLILMDVEMPVLDGYGAARAIRALEAKGKLNNKPRIVALTANAFPSDREKALAAGMDDFLAKPVVLNQLKAMLNRWFSDQASAS